MALVEALRRVSAMAIIVMGKQQMKDGVLSQD
jgi:hypothetical protein